MELVRQARSGAPDAVEVFVQRMRCIPRFLASSNRRFGRPLSVEDLADASQHVFALVWAKADEFRGTARLETWVYPFCRLTFANMTRRELTRASATEVARRELEQPGGARDDGAHLDDALLLEALDRLETESAQVLRLKLFEDLTFEDIGQRLSIPTNTVKSRHYRALASLRDRLRSLRPEAAR